MIKREELYGAGLLAVCLSLLTPAASHAECEHCSQQSHSCSAIVSIGTPEYSQDAVDACDGEPGTAQKTVHTFFLNDPECDGPDPAEKCKACGNESTCHEYFDIGGCHEECQLNFIALNREVESVLASANAEAILKLALRGDMTLDPSRRTLLVTSSCAGDKEYELSSAVLLALRRHRTSPVTAASS